MRHRARSAHRRGARRGLARVLPSAFVVLSIAFAATVVLAIVKERRLEWRVWQDRYRRLDSITASAQAGAGSDADGIQQVWLPDLGRVERCTTCHLALTSAAAAARHPFGRHPGRWLETHRPDRFGCTPCHAGQGEATSFEGAAHRAIPFWPEPMVSPELMEARCGTCHRERRPRGTYWLARGRQRIVDANCAGCHQIPGHDVREVRAPRLDGLARKVNVAWLREWLRDPTAYLPRSRMANFRLPAGDIEALVAFLIAPEGATPRDVDWSHADPERGAEVFRKARCVTCHEVDGRGGTLGPALTAVGSKASREWILQWIRDPSGMQPATLMPRFRLLSADARDLAAYLSADLRSAPRESISSSAPDPSVALEGRRIFERRGCSGCHGLSGFPTLAPIGPKLTVIGDRVADAAPLESRGIAVTLPNWLFAKLRGPETVLASARMPTFGLDEPDAAAIMVALMSLRARVVPPSLVTDEPVARTRGEPPGEVGALMRRYRCLSCHTLGGVGGTLSPVSLDRIGSQLRRDYMARYIANPIAVRVGITERMPHLNVAPEEGQRIAAYLSAVCLDDSLEFEVQRDAAAAARGLHLFENRGCRGCHIVGDKGGFVGPDLNGSGARLKPGWTEAFLREPQRWSPGSLQPNYSLDADDARALTAYVLGLPARTARGAQ